MYIKKKITSDIKVIAIIVAAILFMLVLFLTVIKPQQSSAADTANFNPARIIDDSVFYNATTMSPTDIQNFLNSKVPACDTQGSQIFSGNQTRAQYSATKGYSPPFTCLRDYSMITTAKTADAYCSGYPSAFQSSAQIIYGIAQACGINPQVLLVLLQKEQGLVQDTWPWTNQYVAATGFACPDSTGCSHDPTYGGMFNQLYYAARQFKLYAAKPQSYNYVAGQTQYIAYQANNPGCGGTNVLIQNQATAGLYNYTPYQPNAAALAAGYGSGDGCSAYGNRNFWQWFNDWFGASTRTPVPGCSAATNTTLSCVWKLKKVSNNAEVLTSSYDELTNLLNSVGGYQYVGIAFYGKNASAPSTRNVPVYSLTVGASSFLTSDVTEYQSLKNAGYKDNGVIFYADPAYTNSGYSVYRLYSSQYGHVWTTSQDEMNSYLSRGYKSEGIAFTAMSPVLQETSAPVGTLLVYRFNLGTLGHFWTTDIVERDSMIQQGYAYEGGAWFSSFANTDAPVYRLYSPSLRQHLFTSDLYEKNTLANTPGWTYEGISFYQPRSTAGAPVYRLYSPITYQHLLTTNAYERSVLINNGTYRDEGTAWYQP